MHLQALLIRCSGFDIVVITLLVALPALYGGGVGWDGVGWGVWCWRCAGCVITGAKEEKYGEEVKSKVVRFDQPTEDAWTSNEIVINRSVFLYY